MKTLQTILSLGVIAGFYWLLVRRQESYPNQPNPRSQRSHQPRQKI